VIWVRECPTLRTVQDEQCVTFVAFLGLEADGFLHAQAECLAQPEVRTGIGALFVDQGEQLRKGDSLLVPCLLCDCAVAAHGRLGVGHQGFDAPESPALAHPQVDALEAGVARGQGGCAQPLFFPSTHDADKVFGGQFVQVADADVQFVQFVHEGAQRLDVFPLGRHGDGAAPAKGRRNPVGLEKQRLLRPDVVRVPVDGVFEDFTGTLFFLLALAGRA